MDWIVFLKIHYVEYLSLSVTILVDRAYQEVMNINEVKKVSLNLIGLLSL